MYKNLENILLNEDLSTSEKYLSIVCIVRGFTCEGELTPKKVAKYGLSSSTISRSKPNLPWDEISRILKEDKEESC